jgi:peptidoglycan/LPS O-acetylase OafA/YrhL
MDSRSGTQPWEKVASLSTLLIGIGFLFSSLPIFSYPGFAGLIASVAASDGAASRILGASAIVFLGEISFSLYLAHWPLIQIRNWISDSVATSTWFSSAALLPIIFIVSLCSWHYVERPGREIGRRLVDGKLASSRAPG